MQSIELKRSIIDALDKLPVHIVSGNGIQHTVRCPYCGDSVNLSHGHFSIKIDEGDEYAPMLFRCFKCNTTGILNRDILNDLGVDVGSNIDGELRKFTQKSAKYNKITDSKTEAFEVPTSSSNLAITKLDYVNERLGMEMNIHEAKDKRIILSLIDFMNLNNIKGLPNMSYKKIEFLDKNYVGFLSSNRNVITMRAINSYPDRRYEKILINPRNYDTNTFYTIPAAMDIMYTDDLTINISEGIFDILGIKNYRKSDDELYYAVCGFGYTHILRNVIRLGFNTDLIINIYADNDKSDKDIIIPLRRSKNITPFLKKVYLYRNRYEGQKDFGVPIYLMDPTKRDITNLIR